MRMRHAAVVAGLALGWMAGTAQAATISMRFNYEDPSAANNNGLQTFTIDMTGVYQLVAYGAQGGSSGAASGGLASVFGGDFNLISGQTLTIVVGGLGGSLAGIFNSGGGGGGSFVSVSRTIPLLVAGGGGGAAAQYVGGDGLGLSTGTGLGGGSSGNFGGGGGGGFITDGVTGSGNGGSGGGGGKSFLNSAAGGAAGDFTDAGGGFGGGGGAGVNGGGGGGGYDGGNGSSRDGGAGTGIGTGGTSYINDAFYVPGTQIGGAGLNTGNGFVSLDLISSTSTPTVPLPASAPMFGAALLTLGAVGYGVKRKKAAAAV